MLKRTVRGNVATYSVIIVGIAVVGLGDLPPVVAQTNATDSARPVALSISAALAEAVAANPSAAAALQDVIQAKARLEQTRAQQRLQVSLTSSVTSSNVDVIQPPPAHQSFGLIQNTLSVPVPIGRKPRFLIEQSQRQLDAATATWEGTRLTLASQVATAYYDVLRKQALRDLAQQTLDQANQQLAQSQKRFRAGDVPELDTIRAQVPVSTAEAGVYQAENDLTVAQQALNVLLGRPLSQSLTLVDAAQETGAQNADLPYTATDALTKALAANTDVRAADATVQANEAAVAAAKRYREPSLALQVNDIRSNDQTGFSRENNIQAAITIPLNDGGLGKAQIKEAEAALTQSKLLATAARRTAEANVSAAYLTAQSSRRQAQAAATARDIAQISYDKTLKGYTSGLFPLTDVLTAQAALRQAQIAYIQALYDTAAAGTVLDNVVGGNTILPPTSSNPTNATAPATPPGVNPVGPGAPGTTPSGIPTPTTPTPTTPPGSGKP